MRPAQDRAGRDGGLVSVVQPMSQPVIDRLGDGVVSRGDGQSVFVIAQYLFELVLRLSLGFAAPPLNDPLSGRVIAQAGSCDPPLTVSVPVQTAIASATSFCHVRLPLRLRAPEG